MCSPRQTVFQTCAMAHQLCLQRLAVLPEAVQSISCLETGDVILSSKSNVWVFPSHLCGQAALPQVECEATCILALGSQTIAAGDHAGRVKVWHLRRQTLKEVRNIHVHFSAIRAISSGGDILLTASDDGSVKQLDVLSNFVPSDFFTTGVPATSVLARGKNVLVGCEDGVVWELSRRLNHPTVLRRLELGAPVLSLDADPEFPGARVLAVGHGRFAVWLDIAHDVEEAQPPTFSGKSGPDAAVKLLPGQPQDLLVISGSAPLDGASIRRHASFDQLKSAQTCRALGRDPQSNLSFYFVAEVLQGANRQMELFRILPLEDLPSRDEADKELASSPEDEFSSLNVPSSPKDGEDDDEAEKSIAGGPSRSRSHRRVKAFRDPTQASLAKIIPGQLGP
eukprot:s2330_g4.t1